MLFNRIKEKCEEQGITISELEKKAGIAEKSIGNWRRVMPAADKLVKVACVLHTTVEELLKE